MEFSMLRDGSGGCTLKAMSRVKKGMFSVRLVPVVPVLVAALAVGLLAQIQFPGSGGPFPGGGGGPIGGGGGGRGGENSGPASRQRRKDTENTPREPTT